MPTPLLRRVRPATPLLLSLLLLLGPAADSLAQMGSADIRGRAPGVIDSGLLEFGGQQVYLYGLRGAQADEICRPQGGEGWPCGREARWAARNRIAKHWVECLERARGPGGEIFAVCYLGGVGGPELNAWLVEQGWARAARDYAQDYVAAETKARNAARGLWRRP